MQDALPCVLVELQAGGNSAVPSSVVRELTRDPRRPGEISWSLRLVGSLADLQRCLVGQVSSSLLLGRSLLLVGSLADLLVTGGSSGGTVGGTKQPTPHVEYAVIADSCDSDGIRSDGVTRSTRVTTSGTVGGTAGGSTVRVPHGSGGDGGRTRRLERRPGACALNARRHVACALDAHRHVACALLHTLVGSRGYHGDAWV